MRRADFRIKAPARVEIVVNPTGSRSLQPSRLFLAHQSERETKLERRILAADARAGFGQMIDFARAGSAHAAHHAVAPCSARNRHPRPLAQLFDALHFVYGNVGARNPRLRAVAAIFRTYTALRVAQDADFNAAPEGRLAHSQGRGEQFGNRSSGQFRIARPSGRSSSSPLSTRSTTPVRPNLRI